MIGEVNRRRFLERMAAMVGGAGVPGVLGGSIAGAGRRDAAWPGQRPAASVGAAAPAAQRPAAPRIDLEFARRTPPADLADCTIAEAAQLIRDGSASAEEIVKAYLARIARWEPVYEAFNTVLSEGALEAARSADSTAPSRRRPLAGIPLAIKDNFCTAGVRTTVNSYIFEDFVPDFDATAWARLREAGAILLGKTQMGPLATTAATTPEGERTTVNAWAPYHESVSPGGSSSGSATAVAARLAPCGTGTQTGGSITAPSNAQGLTGIKPTMGRVSLHGIVPLTYTRDHAGPLARDAVDAAIMLQAMAGPDPADPRSLGLPPVPDYVGAVGEAVRRTRNRSVHGPLEHPDRRRPVRIGVLPGYLGEAESGDSRDEPLPLRDRLAAGASGRPDPAQGASGESRSVMTMNARRRMLGTLAELGAEVIEVDFPREWETLTSREFNNTRLPERSEIFLEELRGDVRKFGVALSPWINGLLLPGAEYVRGSRARLILLKEILDGIFSQCDLVTQTQPFPFDIVGLPLIAFPIGFETDSTGYPRPIGALLGGEPYAEHHLLAAVAAYQQATEWHRRRPADPGSLQRVDGGDRRDGVRRRYDLQDVEELGE